jgi:hypothetical protein
MKNRITAGAVAFLMASAGAQAELLNDPGFDSGDTFWGTFGAAGINDFFGGDPHASMFADNNGNFGGVFDANIASIGGTLYEFSLTNVRIESNFNADFRFGLEFYGADNSTKLGEFFLNIDTQDPTDGLVTGDGLTYSMQATAMAGSAFIRPIILFDDAAPLGGSQANAFVFSASLTVVPAPAGLALVGLGLPLLARRRR